MATNSNGQRRRERIFAAVVLVIILASLAVTVPVLLRQANVVRYSETWFTASPSILCPGDTFTYQARSVVDEAPAYMRIVETWHEAKTGIARRAYSTTDEIGSIVPRDVSVQATRMVPQGLTPGEWELHHINETHVSGKHTVSGYGVRITVLDCD